MARRKLSTNKENLLQKCMKSIERVTGTLPKDRAETLEKRIAAALRKYDRAGDDVTDIEAEILNEINEAGRNAIIQAKIEARNQYLNYLRTDRMINYVMEHYPNDPVRGFDALLVGVQSSRFNTRHSTASIADGLKYSYLRAFLTDIDKYDKQFKKFDEGMQREVAKALYEYSKKTPDEAVLKELPEYATDVAKAMRKAYEMARADANRYGSWIGSLEGWIGKTGHDPKRIKDAGFDAWKQKVSKMIDETRTMIEVDGVDVEYRYATPAARENFLGDFYGSVASGHHYTATGAEFSGFKGYQNIGKKMSHERKLHFKDSDAWMDYMKEFGRGNLFETMVFGLSHSARNNAMMASLGPNAQTNFEKAVTHFANIEKDPEVKGRIAKSIQEGGMLYNRMRHVNGEANNPVNVTASRIFSILRALETLAKLGGSVITAFSDIPLFAKEYSRHGKSLFDGYSKAIGAVADSLTSPREKKQAMNAIGVFSDAVIGDVIARAAGEEDLNGSVSRMVKTYFKFNLLQPWTDSLRGGAAMAFANIMADNTRYAYGALDDSFKSMMKRFGIEEAEWEILRLSKHHDFKGQNLFVYDEVLNIDDAVFKSYLESKGQKATDYRIRDAKHELSQKVHSYIIDRAETAVIHPDEKTRSMMLQGTRPGTVEGEILRTIGQFKQFPVGIMQRQMGDELLTNYEWNTNETYAKNMKQAIMADGYSGARGVASLVVQMTLFGYMAMTAKDLAKGKTPEDVTPESIMRAFLQGGGGGLYADFLFGELRTSHGGGLLGVVAGPTMGSAAQIADIWGRVKSGEDAGAAALKATFDHTPFLGLFYVRPTFNYLIGYDIMERVSPGAAQRIESKAQEKGQEYMFLSPTQAIQ